MSKKQLSIEQKNASKDLDIIICSTLIPLFIYLVFGNKIMGFVKTSNINIWLKFIPLALMQFGLAGLGSLIVIIYRKEKMSNYGLIKKNILQTILLSIIVCIPAFLFMLINNEISVYFPLKGVLLSKNFLTSSFPSNVLGYLLIVVIWGFFEGFNYVVISKK